MNAGYAVTKQRLDAQAADAIYQLREVFARVQRLKADLDAYSSADLQALGYDANGADTVKSAFTDLNKLVEVGYGRDTQAQASNFLYFALQLVRLS